MQLVIFGVKQMDFGMDIMKAKDLLLAGNELIPFFGVSGNGEAGDGKLDASLRLNGGGNDGVVAEDLFGLVRVGRFSAHANTGGAFIRRFGTAETESIGSFAYQGLQRDSVNVRLWESENEAEFGELFFDAEESEVIGIDQGELLGGILQNEGVGVCGNGADEREIDDGRNQLRYAAANGTVVVDMDELLAELVVGKPAGLFLREGFTVTVVDERIDFPELSDNIGNCEASQIAHVKDSGVSRERVRPSNDLPGSPFLLVTRNQPASLIPRQTNGWDSSLSTKTGGMASRSFPCA